MNNWKVKPLAQEFTKIYESPDPERIFCYSPGIAVLDRETDAGTDDSRLVATAGPRWVGTLDLGGPGVKEDIEGVKYERGESGYSWQGRVYTSDDQGQTWSHRVNFPFMHARPFVAGSSVYVLGQAGDLMIIRSDDEGETWSEAVKLTEGQHWHQAPSNVWYANGCIYLVMERRVADKCRGWNICENAPVLMRAPVDADLTKRKSWTFSNEFAFCDNVPDKELEWHGIPFFPAYYPEGVKASPGRNCAPAGWLETNVVQFTDPNHCLHDSEGKTFHLWARAHTGGTGYAAVAKAVEKGDTPGTGEIKVMFETVPSGKKILYVPCPGGQMKFHVLYDEQTKLYWLLSTQATDSMCRPENLPEGRYNLPNNERRRLQLHFSRNMIDWCFAGLVAVGPCEKGSRHYASMAIDGDDLYVLSRSGDERSCNAHDTNMITFHTVRNFRELVY